MPTANEEFLDALIRHQVYLMRFSGSLRDKVIKLLDKTEEALSAAILQRIGDRRGFDPSSRRRLELLRRVINNIRGAAWDKATEVWLAELRDLARYEPAFTRAALTVASPVVIDTILPPPETLRSIVTSTPMEGHVLRAWASRQRATDLDRIMSAVQTGMVQGEPAADIARRVVGTRQLHKRDGVTEVTRREADALTRTAVNFISNATRREFFKENEDLFDFEQFVATLDARTTPVCRANDGKRFKIGQGPIPPLHFNCRSTRVAVIDGDVMGERPSKPFTERQLVQEYATKNNLGDISSRDDLPRGHKTPFDSFQRGRVRDLTGTVPAKTTYQEWLTRQSAAFQDDVLGPTRGKLFRRGGLALDKFVNRQGDQLPLADLVSREREAFIKAGLDPDSF